MKKPESAEQFAKRKAKEAKEIQKWERIKAQKLPKHYFFFLMIIVTVVYIVDEISSNMNGTFQPYIYFDFFNIVSRSTDDPLYASAINQMTAFSIITMGFGVIQPFYKSLSDIYGRRLFLMINTCMMGVGLFVCLIAPNIIVYLIGVMLLSFVTPNDVQVLYIMEVAPKDKRSTLCFLTKAIAWASVSLISILQRVFFSETDFGWWRRAYLIPVAVALVVGLASIIFTRETPVFMDERLKFLKTSEEERAERERKVREEKSANKGGLINAFKFIFAHKQTRNLAFAVALFGGTTLYTSHYATIMKGGLTDEGLQTAIFIYPFVNAIASAIFGHLMDKLGRKKACTLCGVWAVVMLTLFILSARLGFGPYAMGIFYGASIGGLWTMSDTMCMTIPAESAPSEIRASVMSATGLFYGIGMIISTIIITVFQNIFNIGWVCLATCAPFMILAIFILLTKVHETAGVDLEKVTGYEYD